MTDATTHRHAHDHASESVIGAHDHGRIAPARASLLEASAAARVTGVCLVLVALWAGVYWALH
ncbi:hypothetical protein [Methylocystis parvus]|uniref:hypothetical protein n=1 Tax=Methylocystis parvus TaxID=134 RepID=UPI003C7106E0